MTKDFEQLSNKMAEEQLVARGVRSETVLEAMRKVPRHLFVPENLQSHAYTDSPLPIGSGQTISQPYIVAYMTEQLDLSPGMKVLEIGTGSGYQAAILSYLDCDVFTVELLEDLATRAKKVFNDLSFDNIKTRHGSGYMGWLEEAPFDAIIVTAAPDKIPERLLEQLKNGGKMIVPVGQADSTQVLKIITKLDGTPVEENLLPVRFVPMVETDERVYL